MTHGTSSIEYGPSDATSPSIVVVTCFSRMRNVPVRRREVLLLVLRVAAAGGDERREDRPRALERDERLAREVDVDPLLVRAEVGRRREMRERQVHQAHPEAAVVWWYFTPGHRGLAARELTALRFGSSGPHVISLLVRAHLELAREARR